ncbi:TRAP transporter substrate-binding protein [Hyphomonas johnsonii]|uniref:TRAP dicarboxylate transporter subunit DctP n=1 Tax=Hyphomonas johnsonii MHS-2 TaxID=1280950 RepID=A0A059FS79_9PROT|nr:TRAP transporter substrate-binding protein [Hyphomonas johnsonii]KCZ93376.1 TRAP dicarboxylate transporter subunit DctP [Hyphomonas johnsonii MHS-2]
MSIPMTRRTVLGAAAATALPCLAACSDETRQMIATDAQPAGYPTVQALQFFSDTLAERSGGRIRFHVYAGAQLGSENDTIELAQFGGVDIIRVNSTPMNVIVAETLVPALPFLFRDIDHMRRAMDGAPGQAILDALAPKGLIGLCFYDSGARSFYTASRLIHQPKDLAGLKIRVQSSDLLVSMVEALGGDATPMSYGEVYQGMMQGVIDGAENNWPSYESSRHYEVAPFYSETRHVMAPEILAMSRRAWERLTAPDQELVLTCARESVPFMRDIWDARVRTAEAAVLAAGVTVTDDIDHTAFARRVEPVWAKYLKSPALKRLAEDVQAVGATDA